MWQLSPLGTVSPKNGHTVKGMSPKHVKPFISKQKTDANDAIGIAITSSKISMPLCQVKTVEQQSLQSLQVSRKWFDKTITSLGNHMRALCYEFGVTTAKSKVALRHRIMALLDDEVKTSVYPMRLSAFLAFCASNTPR
jgi:transposase